MAKSTSTKSPAMEKLTESVGELKVFQLGTKEQQTPGEKGKQRRGGNKRSSKRGSLKSPNLDGRNSRRTTRANDQKMAKKARHKKNRTPIKEEKTVNSNLKEGDKKNSREEVVDFSQLDAVVSTGDYKDFLGKRVTDEEEDIIKIQLLINSRKTVMKVPLTIDVKATDIREPNSDDMIASIDLVDDETEDKDLIKHENNTWECPKCNQENKNDAGYCVNIIDDKLCGGTKKAEKILDWSGCFGPTTKMWQCDACLVKNEESADVCAACEKKRP